MNSWGRKTLTIQRRPTPDAADLVTEEASVRELSVDELEGYLGVYFRETARIDYVCGKEAGWAATLTRESHEAVIAADEETNRPFFERWKGRRDRDAALLRDPVEVETLKAAMVQVLTETFAPMKDVVGIQAAAMLSGGSSPSSAPSPA